jgi:hypothetical protein
MTELTAEVTSPPRELRMEESWALAAPAPTAATKRVEKRIMIWAE